MTRKRACCTAAVVTMGMLLLATRTSSGEAGNADHGGFTGEVKLVFYVQDVRRAVPFYTGALGFKFHHFYDHVSGDSVSQWTRDVPPIYAEMS